MPGTPRAVGRSQNAIQVQFSSPASAARPTSYRVYYSTDSDVTTSDPYITISVGTTTATITGLQANTDYWVAVQARNAAGNSALSPSLATSTTAPSSNHQQVIQLSADIYSEIRGAFGLNPTWTFQSPLPAIDDGLKQNPNDDRYLWRVLLSRSSGDRGAIWIAFANNPAGDSASRGGDDLSETFETQGQIILETGGTTLTFNMADINDSSDEYTSEPIAGLGTTIDTIAGRSGNQSATLTLRNYTP